MPTLRDYKVAFKGASLAFYAGAHCLSQQVYSKKVGELPQEERELLEDDLFHNLRDVIETTQSSEFLAEFLSEEGLYPLADLWLGTDLEQMISLLKPPKLVSEEDSESPFEFRFKKGFLDTLTKISRAQYIERDEEAEVSQSLLDHWLVLIINASFHAGCASLASSPMGGEDFYNAMSELEDETECWSRYPQITLLLEKEISRENSEVYGESETL